ncbi:hypothetical protein HK105_200319 [Polyrhizophydium stewartii]|uniref:Ankyrin repeat protein n=1 Tax=Polyrhizophydium stewartii TaxID=2732419 RepID=A0ABR4NLA5_9FUNG
MPQVTKKRRTVAVAAATTLYGMVFPRQVGTTVRRLPHGKSHMDRLPAELRDMIALHAAPSLCKFLRHGRRSRAELDSIAGNECEALWAEVLDVEWLGDFKMLPNYPERSDCLLSIRSRSMLERLLKSGVEVPLELKQRLLIRRGWLDMLDYEAADIVAHAAAREGSIQVLNDLMNVRRIVPNMCPYHRSAAREGQLEAVKWLCSNATYHALESLLDVAASSGNLDLVKWLHENTQFYGTGIGIDEAAWKGYIHIITWFADNRREQCTGRAFRWACNSGRVDVLEVLRVRYPTVFAGTISSTFEGAKHACTLDWIKQYRPHFVPHRAFNTYICTGNLEATAWMVENAGALLTRDMLHIALRDKHVALAGWMIAEKKLEVDGDWLEPFLISGNTAALGCIAQSDHRWTSDIIDMFIANHRWNLVKWLAALCPSSLGQAWLEEIIQEDRLLVFKIVIEHYLRAGWNLKRARQVSADAGVDRITALLDARIARHL